VVSSTGLCGRRGGGGSSTGRRACAAVRKPVARWSPRGGQVGASCTRCSTDLVGALAPCSTPRCAYLHCTKTRARRHAACKGLDTPILWRSLYISRSWEGAVLGIGSSTLSSCRLNAALVFGGPATPSALHGGAGSMPRVDCRRSLRVPRAEACTPADGRLSLRGEGRPEEKSASVPPASPAAAHGVESGEVSSRCSRSVRSPHSLLEGDLTGEVPSLTAF